MLSNLWSTVQLIGVEATCSIFLGSCDGIECDVNCKANYTDGKGSCYFNNLCTCFYDRAPPKDTTEHFRQCTIGYQQSCDADCDESCCNSKCAKTFRDGLGNCVDYSGNKLCICHYSPQ